MVKKITPIKLAQWGQKHMLYLPLYIAIHGGILKQYHIDVELIYSGNDNDVFNAVANGVADFGVGDPIFTDLVCNLKKNVTCVGVFVQRMAAWGITNKPAIPLLKTVADFVQLRIGSFPRPSTTYTVISALKEKNKRLLRYMQIIEAPIGQQAELLKNNQADIVLEIEPMVSLAEENNLRAVFSLVDYSQIGAITGLMVSKEFEEKNKSTVDNFIKALEQSLNICHKNEKIALEIAAMVFPEYDPKILEKAYQRLVKADVWPTTLQINRTAWQTSLKLREKTVASKTP